MLLAISTTRGIQAESDENASGSSAAAGPNDGASAVGPRRHRRAAATEPQVERALLLGQDADGEVEPPDELVEAVPEDARPRSPG